jgi:hypothetical protein
MPQSEIRIDKEGVGISRRGMFRREIVNFSTRI